MVTAKVETLNVIEVKYSGMRLDKLQLHSGEKIANITRIEKSKEIARIYLEENYDFSKAWSLQVDDMQIPVIIGGVVRTEAFDEAFYYDGTDLGATYDRNETLFKIWSPFATEVRLLLYKNWHDQTGEEIELLRGDKGVWHMTVKRDLAGFTYEYKLCVNGEWRLAVDPYARSVTINGEKGMIIALDKTNPSEWPVKHDSIEPADAIIYEVHIRDFSIDPRSGMRHKGKYLAFTEQGTKGPKRTTTGLDYLCELGVTHIELLPVHDFGSIDESKQGEQYNWGYDPIHYFAPEGSYATDAYNGFARIAELKALIATLHKQNLSVILDVVFNHVYIWQKSNFEKIMPGYFFRIDEHGKMADGTGVGNDIASERKMVRKFIADCVEYWAREYQVDGFRFDLMGIHDIETMKEVERRLERLHKPFLLLGEGWNLSTPYPEEKRAIISEAKQLEGYAFFNDRFRDSIKGSTFDVKNRGFISGDGKQIDAAMNAILGTVGNAGTKEALFTHPQQSINYVESHDNHTLWDKLLVTNGNDDEAIREKMHRLGTTITLLSQGIPFLHAGQEFFRTKRGDGNSYQSPDAINMLDWRRKAQYEEQIDFIKSLINIRKRFSAFRLRTKEQLKKHIKRYHFHEQMISYALKDIQALDACEQIFVAHYSGQEPIEILLPIKGEWKVIVDEKSASLLPLYTLNSNRIIVKPMSSYVLYLD